MPGPRAGVAGIASLSRAADSLVRERLREVLEPVNRGDQCEAVWILSDATGVEKVDAGRWVKQICGMLEKRPEVLSDVEALDLVLEVLSREAAG